MAVENRNLQVLGNPHYIDIGSFHPDKSSYEAIAEGDLNFGDLDDVISYKELITLTTDDKSADRPNWEVVVKIVMRAEAEVNSYLARLYPVPVVTKISSTEVIVPTQVAEWTMCILRYKFYQRRPHIPDSVKEDYQMCLTKLEAASRGIIKIVELELDGDDIASSDTPETIAIVGGVDRPVNISGRYSQRDKIGRNADDDRFAY